MTTQGEASNLSNSGGANQGSELAMGPYIKDVHKIFKIFNPPSPFVCISCTLSGQ